jgi:hypothetical protein
VAASTYGTFVTPRKNRPHAVNGGTEPSAASAGMVDEVVLVHVVGVGSDAPGLRGCMLTT